MARINTNVSSVVAQRHLAQSYGTLNTTIQRLSSGLRITRGADDPAGLIASERLRSEIAAVRQAVSNTQRASTIVSTTEGALDEVSRLLNDVQNLIVQSANAGALSEDEIKANQLQIDSAINSITRIANSTTFAGRHLLNGALDYVTSGVDNSVVNALDIHSAQFGTQPFIPVNVTVTTSAQPGELLFPNGSITADTSIELSGPTGVTTLPFSSGATASAIAAAINAVADTTGVTAIMSSNVTSGFVLKTDSLGSRQFVSVKVLPGGGAFNTTDASGNAQSRDEGRDAVATINGTATHGDGNKLSLQTSSLDIELQLDSSFGVGSTSFAITEGGALFQVGPEVNSALQVNLGVRSVAASRLGNSDVGYLSQVLDGGDYSVTKGKAREAQKIIGEALRQVVVLRGRLGAFEKNTLDTNANQLNITMENLMSAESQIRDADFAYETSQLSRNQVLVSSGTQVLGLANQMPQQALQLLQR